MNRNYIVNIIKLTDFLRFFQRLKIKILNILKNSEFFHINQLINIFPFVNYQTYFTKKNTMTLQIKVTKIMGKSTENCQLILTGKTTGTFLIHNFYQQQDERRKAYFSLVDNIQMSLYNGGTVPNPFNRKAFINQPCELIAEFMQRHKDYQEGDKWYSYDVQLYTQQDQPYAIVHMMVKYTRGLLLQGILPNTIEKKLRSFTFFKGNFPHISIGGYNGKTSNIFNFLDFCCQPQSHDLQFNPIENIYDDIFQ